ncbi:MAG TPA: tRNA (adenosine(37)-N6)-dimethylallyltransferase MiaA [Acidimicrobiia bacterium]|nr:tRNA (adenosine(37)-N6)-dimethylallyltransferase MiaA [Acidimicrobiia bacterium]
MVSRCEAGVGGDASSGGDSGLSPRILAVLGPTASGKTSLAIEVALRLGAEIVSADSMQVYRGMNIGTAKPTLIERRGVAHHLIDLVDPEEEFSVADYRRLGREVIGSAHVPLIIAGGSGLHFRALVDPMSFAPTDDELRADLEERDLRELVAELIELDPEASTHVDLENKRRVVRAVEIAGLTGETPSVRARSAEAEDLRRYVPDIEFTAVGIDPGSTIDARVGSRLAQMRSGGLVDEVRSLRDRLGRTARSALGYREILDHLEGERSLDDAFETIAQNTKKLARKQRTWFQRDPRIRWIPWTEDESSRVERAMEIFE